MKIRIILPLLACATAAVAQENAPIGVLRGDLVAWSGTNRSGLLTFNNADGHLLQCSFDDKTWFERENQRIAVNGARAGDRLEVVADHKPATAACYARTVHIVDTRLPIRTAAGKPRLRFLTGVTDSFAPRGDMTFSGVVLGVTGNWLTLRTRTKGNQTILLRPDTRYLGRGLPAERSNVENQMTVFIRAGRNLDGDIEAYQVVWGDILQVNN